MKHFEHTTSMQREQQKESGEEGDIPNVELDFSQPLLRIKVFNQMKKIIARSSFPNGTVDLPSLQAMLQDIRFKMNLELFDYENS